MFKRMSILLRKPEDTRDSFASKWERHGKLVSQLPLIRAYLQNHVIERFGTRGVPEADGIVELLFDRPEDMTTAFSDPRAALVRMDEPGFLGHGTGYALERDSPCLPASQGEKLIVMLDASADEKLAAALLGEAASSRGFRGGFRDNVKTIIARPEMERGPQQVLGFLHLLFDDVETASDAGRRLAEAAADAEAASIFRVRTITVLPLSSAAGGRKLE
jgi:uncharacterized protein (TIGR02118 family)